MHLDKLSQRETARRIPAWHGRESNGVPCRAVPQQLGHPSWRQTHLWLTDESYWQWRGEEVTPSIRPCSAPCHAGGNDTLPSISVLCFALLCSHHSTRHSLHRPRSMLLSHHCFHFLSLSTLILRPVCFLSYTQVVNKRLFAVVREERRLTYDASFKLLGQNSIQGGWYQVSVTSNPSQVWYSHLLKMKALSLWEDIWFLSSIPLSSHPCSFPL